MRSAAESPERHASGNRACTGGIGLSAPRHRLFHSWLPRRAWNMCDLEKRHRKWGSHRECGRVPGQRHFPETRRHLPLFWTPAYLDSAPQNPRGNRDSGVHRRQSERSCSWPFSKIRYQTSATQQSGEPRNSTQGIFLIARQGESVLADTASISIESVGCAALRDYPKLDRQVFGPNYSAIKYSIQSQFSLNRRRLPH